MGSLKVNISGLSLQGSSFNLWSSKRWWLLSTSASIRIWMIPQILMTIKISFPYMSSYRTRVRLRDSPISLSMLLSSLSTNSNMSSYHRLVLLGYKWYSCNIIKSNFFHSFTQLLTGILCFWMWTISLATDQMPWYPGVDPIGQNAIY